MADLSPLKDMKLTNLDCWRHAGVRPVAAEGHEADVLDCGSTQVSDLSPLKDMKLTNLDCNSTQVTDLSPLKA